MEQRALFEEAGADHWSKWLKNECVEVPSEFESKKVLYTVGKERVIASIVVYRDKNASIRTPQRELPAKAKARLVVMGQNCPDYATGRIKTELPWCTECHPSAFCRSSPTSAGFARSRSATSRTPSCRDPSAAWRCT